MSSELAESICTTYFNNSEGALLRSVVDAELNEVREVLAGLGPEHHRHFHADILIPFEQCSHAKCKRIRELMARLSVDGERGE